MAKKRIHEISQRLKEIRCEINSCRYHNTEPLSAEKITALYEEENSLINEYRTLF